METQENRRTQLARDILTLSRNTLLVNLRFLDAALSQFTWIPVEVSSLLTDGKHVFYNPSHILQCYKAAKEIPARDYLHIVLHCIFRHMYMDPSLERTYWDLACDIAVESAISDLGLSAVTAAREQGQQAYIQAVKKDLKHVTAEKIYYYLRQTAPDPKRVAEIRRIFCADNHEIWYMTATEIKMHLGLSERTLSRSEENIDESSRDENDNGAVDEGLSAESRQAMQQIWKSISERMQVELETFGKQHGMDPGGLTQNLKAVNREKYDYTEFLKKFAVMGEAMKINDDEFDYNFYTYGLKLYKNMPLIEPLEYKDVKRIREFVIAIDTSGSTFGELVQTFLQKTYNILKSTESFFTKINLHIIQCDAAIQEDVKIETQADFDRYLEKMKIRGRGGTDFRPVFQHVDKLLQNKEFTNLKGLIYFTDGFGEFPSKKPDYETAFVFVDDEDNNPDVPPWAIKLVLQRNEI